MSEHEAVNRVLALKQRRNSLISKVTHSHPSSIEKNSMLAEIKRITKVLNQGK